MNKLTLIIWLGCFILFQGKAIGETTNFNNFSVVAQKVDHLTKIGKYQKAFSLVDSVFAAMQAETTATIPVDWQLRKVYLDYELENYECAKKALATILTQPAKLQKSQHLRALALQTKVFTDFGLYDQSDSIAAVAFSLLTDTLNYNEAHIRLLNAHAYNQYPQQSIELYNQSKQLQTAAGIPDTILYLETLVFLSWLQSDVDSLQQDLAANIDFCLSLPKMDNIFYAEWMEFYGDYLNGKERYRESIDALTIVDKIFSESYGENHRFTIENINNLAVVFIHLQDYFNAEKNYSRALAIQKSFGENR